MTLALDQISRRKLILAKQLFHHGVEQSTHYSSMRRILAIVSFDLAIETVLRATVSGFDTAKTPGDGFLSVVQQCDAALTKAGLGVMPDRANILHVHGLRNDAQHKVKYPNESDLGDSRTYTRDFLAKHVRVVWGIEFSNLSMSELVQDPKVRDFLQSAETHLEAGRAQDAARNAFAGLSWGMKQISTFLVGRLTFSNFMSSQSQGKFGSDPESREVIRSLERMQTTLLYVALGLDYSNYMRCRRIVGSVQLSQNGTPSFHGGKEKMDLSDAEVVLAFCTESILMIEDRVGSLEAPLTPYHWV